MLTLDAVCKTWAAAGHHPQQSGSDGGAQRPGADCGAEACAAVGCAVRPEPVACQGGAECPCQPPPTPRPPVHQHILPIGRLWLPLACTCMLVRPSMHGLLALHGKPCRKDHRQHLTSIGS